MLRFVYVSSDQKDRADISLVLQQLQLARD